MSEAKLLTLYNLFGLSDAGLTNPTNKKTLVDLNDPRLSFSPAELSKVVRALSVEIRTKFAKELNVSLTCERLTEQKVIAFSIPNSATSVIATLAIAGDNFVAAPLPQHFHPDEIRPLLGDMGANVLLVPKGGSDEAEAAAARHNIPIGVLEWQFVEGTPTPKLQRREGFGIEARLITTDPKDEPLPKVAPYEFSTALFLHTSGTTAAPKGVPISHRNLTCSLFNFQRTYRLKGGPEVPEHRLDKTLSICPHFHVHGLIGGVLGPLAVQSRVCIARGGGFHVSTFWEDLNLSQATWLTLVPTMLQIIANDTVGRPANIPKLRFIRTASSPLAKELSKRASEMFKCTVLEAYAMTEAAHQVCANPIDSEIPLGDMQAVGIPIGTELAIVDSASNRCLPIGGEGEIWVRGPNVIEGYHKFTDEENSKFFTTNDKVVWPAVAISAGKALAAPGRQLSKGSLLPEGGAVAGGKTKDAAGGLKISQEELQMKPSFRSSVLDVGLLARYMDVPWKFTPDLYLSEEPMLAGMPPTVPWFRTGDVGVMDEDGLIQLKGRAKFLINRGGEKISPGEVSNAILGLIGVKDAQAYGVKDPVYGEAVHAAILVEPELKSLKEDELTSKLRKELEGTLAKMKIPVKFRVVDEMPRLPSGKVDLRLLIETDCC